MKRTRQKDLTTHQMIEEDEGKIGLDPKDLQIEEGDRVLVGEQAQQKHCRRKGRNRLIETLKNIIEVDVSLQKRHLTNKDWPEITNN